MTAPDIKTLLSYEAQLEPAVSAVLVADGVNASQRFAEERDAQGAIILKQTPFVDVLLSGAPTGHKHVLDGVEIYDAWEGTCKFRVNTTRGQDSDQHAGILGQIRFTMLQYASKITAQLAPYHEFRKFKETGEVQRTVDEENRLDISEISFAVYFNVRAGVWPVALL
jgi:hypothetical protein